MVVSAISVVTLLIREVIVHFDSTSHGYAIAREDRRKPIKGNFQSLSLSFAKANAYKHDYNPSHIPNAQVFEYIAQTFRYRLLREQFP
jgi:hypothetical protein